MGLSQEAKKLLEKQRKKHNPFPGPDFHHKFMLEYGKLRHAHNPDFDFEVYKTAVWLHDLGRFHPEDKTGESKAEREYHKELGARIFDREFEHLVKDDEKRKTLKACILEHSGEKASGVFRRRKTEVDVIREADRISFLHPDYIKWLVKKGKSLEAFKILERNYREFLEIKPSAFAAKIADEWRIKSERIIADS